ncbi:hypothetical protein Pse7367_3230 [Thalassoporum mexicanum PCC 7367]|uniref:PAN/Apple domain-containing protein n=1 Tax=Thalassoporum mexicanum TaxID=3457544 RepID=UPI00029FBF05|nr:PAN/Apple domain-containing protein [Pseudanabaena sp. PCC 7367]AFY71475.1 hypothetical protein Pse7367_3230 [Pseudanabaena sp. PCC 7367]
MRSSTTQEDPNANIVPLDLGILAIALGVAIFVFGAGIGLLLLDHDPGSVDRFVLEPGIDYFGSDYYLLEVDSVNQCVAECSKRRRCKVFTYVSTGMQPPDHNNDKPLCWLKDRVPEPFEEAGMVSGVKRSQRS